MRRYKKIRDTASLLPQSKLLEAFSYVINHWGGLTVYLEHGIVPISKVIIEQQIRNLKLGAKNWLFAASEVGAETVAKPCASDFFLKITRAGFINYSIIYDSIENLLPDLPPLSCSFIRVGLDNTFPGFDKLPNSMGIHLPRTLHPDGACLLWSCNSESFSFPNLNNVSKSPLIFTWIHSRGEDG